MTSELQKNQRIRSEQLPDCGFEEYYHCLITTACEAGILSEADLIRIQSGLLALLAGRTERYSNGESSSIPIKAARELLNSCVYTMGAALKYRADPEEAAIALRDTDPLVLFGEGLKRIDKLIFQCRQLSTQARHTRIRVPNAAYNTTLGGLPHFFAAYQPEYAAHDTPADIDYPLAVDPGNRTGIEYMQDYLRKLVMENRFCGQFSALTIHRLLLGYDRYYGSLLINLFERIYINALGCILGEQSPHILLLTPETMAQLKTRLQAARASHLPELLEEAAEKLFARLEMPGQAIRQYAACLHTDLAVTIENALSHQCLRAVFVQSETM